MSEKIKIKMFGNKNEIVSSSCGCGPDTSCGPSVGPTTIEMYNDLKSFVANTDIKNKIDMEFISLEDTNLKKYNENIDGLLNVYQKPLTFINEKLVFAGNIDNMGIYLRAKKLLNVK